MRSLITYLRNNMYVPLIIAAFFIVAFTTAPFIEMMEGLWIILTNNGLLLVDTLYISTLSASFLAIGLVTLFNYILVKKFYGKMDGLAFAGLMCVLGFAFFGKNILNTIPVQIGVYLFAKYKKEDFKKYVPTALFATGIAPVVSHAIFDLNLSFFISIPLGLFIGILSGFIIPAIAQKTTTFYDGLNIFNTGFALGLVATILHAIYRIIGVEVERNQNMLSYEYSDFLFIFILVISLLIMICSFIYDKKCVLNYLNLTKTKDQCSCDYVNDFDNDASLFNIGVVGILCLVIMRIINVDMSGPGAGTIFATMGFAGYRVHVKNFIPLLIGTLAAGYLLQDNFTTTTIIAIFLSSGLAPIVGRYGIFAGIISGFLLVATVGHMLDLQGGFGIYNVGFTCGFVALTVVPIFNAFFKEKEERCIHK